jgi:hypothetical protein
LFADFVDIFGEHHGLPPPLSHDHNVALMPRLQLVTVCSYRYPTSYKDELERRYAAILEQTHAELLCVLVASDPEACLRLAESPMFGVGN